MPPSVFISYSRRASRESAVRLFEALGGAPETFLDTEEIKPGQPFPEKLANAILDARVVVVFAEASYFSRWYCLRELQLSLAPYQQLLGYPNVDASELAVNLTHIVVVFPPANGNAPPSLDELPPIPRVGNWPRADELDRVIALIEKARHAFPLSIRQRLGPKYSDALEKTLISESALPDPARIPGPFYAADGIQESLAERFVGRADELWLIHFKLFTIQSYSASAVPRTVVLHGSGGFGKSRLAIEYLWRYAKYYPGGIFWINAEAPEHTLTEHFYNILKELNPVTEYIDERDMERRKKDIHRMLARAAREIALEKAILFIIDNVPEPSENIDEESLKTWCPAIPHVSILATSRFDFGIVNRSYKTIFVNPLRSEDSVQLLSQDVARINLLEEAQWTRIAEWAGNMPVALELLNRLLLFKSLTPLALFNQTGATATDEIDKLRVDLDGNLAKGKLPGITKIFTPSYQKLKPDEQRAARLLSQLEPTPIPDSIVSALSAIFTPGIRATLMNRAFVQSVRDPSNSLFGQMHRIVADFLRSQSVDVSADVSLLISALINLLSESDFNDSGHENSTKVNPAVLSHAGYLLNRAFADEFEINAELVIKLSRRVGEYYYRKGNYAGARHFQREALNHARAAGLSANPEVINILYNNALTRHALGDFEEALALIDQVLKICDAVMASDNPLRINALLAKAEILVARGGRQRRDEANSLIEEARQLCEQSIDEAHSAVHMSAINSLALMYFEQGRYGDSVTLLEKLLTISGQDSKRALKYMVNLAAGLSKLGRFDEALKLETRVRDRRQQLFGFDDPETLTAAMNLALTQLSLGNHVAAIELLEPTVKLLRESLGDTDRRSITALCAFGDALFDSDTNSAWDNYKSALAASEKRFGTQDLETRLIADKVLRATYKLNRASETHEIMRIYFSWLVPEFCNDIPQSIEALAPALASIQNWIAGCTDVNGKVMPEHRLSPRHLIVGS